MSSLQDLTEAALDDFQFSRQRPARDKSTAMLPPTAPTTTTTTTTTSTSTQYVPMPFRTLARSSSGSGFGILPSAADLLSAARTSPNNSGFQLPYRAVAGTAATTASGLVAPLGGSITNMNALFGNNGGNSATDFQFRPSINNASTSLTTLAAAGAGTGAALGFNDSFTFAPPQGASALQLALHNTSRGSNSNLASAIAAQATADGVASVEGLKLFAAGAPAAAVSAPIALQDVVASSAAAAAAAANAPPPPPPRSGRPSKAARVRTADDEYVPDDDDDPVLPSTPARRGGGGGGGGVSAATTPTSAAAAALVKRRRVAHGDDNATTQQSPTIGNFAPTRRKLSRAEARQKLRNEQTDAENALPEPPRFGTIAEAAAYFVAQRQSTMDKSKSPKVRAVIARPEMRGTFVDLTEFLALPQNDAAKMIGVPTSTLSKRWKEVIDNRKWPYRTVCKIDKEIQQLLTADAGTVRQRLDQVHKLLTSRQHVLMPVALRISKVQKLKPDVLPSGLDVSQFIGDDDDDDDDDDDEVDNNETITNV
jgi:hypothetical protein